MSETTPDINYDNDITDTKPEDKDVAPKQAVDLVAVGFRSAFWTVVASVLLFACFINAFPYTAMRMYSALDNKYLALHSAEKYMSRNSSDIDTEAGRLNGYSKYADALYLAVNNSILLMDEAIAEYGYAGREAANYAERVNKHAAAYLACISDMSLKERTDDVNAYSVAHTAPALHPYVYSYTDRLNIAQAKAQFVLGGYDNLEARFRAVSTYWGQESWEITLDKVEQSQQVANDYLFIMQLSAYLNNEFAKLGLGDLIASQENKMLSYDKVPKSLDLSGGNKPFDLFVYDAADAKAGVKNDEGNTVQEGEFKPLYTMLRKYYDEFVDFLVKNSKLYIIEQSTAEDRAEYRANQLTYTYYLKGLSDLTYALYNMSSILMAKKDYFDEPMRDNFNVAYYYWEGRLQVSGVRTWSKEGNTVTNRVSMWQWFNNGMLYDYTRYFTA